MRGLRPRVREAGLKKKEKIKSKKNKVCFSLDGADAPNNPLAQDAAQLGRTHTRHVFNPLLPPTQDFMLQEPLNILSIRNVA